MYINEDKSPNFIEDFIKDEKFGHFICESCDFNGFLASFFIYESANYDLTVIVLFNDYDYNEWLNKFEKISELITAYSEGNVTFRNRPYTLVYGWDGLRNFFKLIKGQLEKDNIPKGKIDEGRLSLMPSDGYQFGELYFYFPDELNQLKFVRGLIAIAGHYKMVNSYDKGFEILKTGAEFINYCSFEICKEVGILALMSDRYKKDAKWFLNQAKKNKHKWLAVTITYSDGTPSQRVSGQTQRPELPHIKPMESLQKVMDIPHTLLKLFPSSEDSNLSYLPQLEYTCIMDRQFGSAQLSAIYGYIIGHLDRIYFEYEEIFNRISGSRHFLLEDLQKEFYSNERDKEESELFHNNFWFQYIEVKWKLPKLIKNNLLLLKNEEIIITAKTYGRTMGIVQKQRNNLEEKDSFEFQWLKTEESFLSHASQIFSGTLSGKSGEDLEIISMQTFYDEMMGEGKAKISRK